MDLGLSGRIALVTGGSHGLGRASAAALCREGAKVAICGRHLDTLEAAAKEVMSATGGEVFPCQADVSVAADIERLVAETVDRFGSIDILVNNADSASKMAEFFDLTDDDWIENWTIKLLAPIRLVRLIAPMMMEKKWGRIISMSGATTRRIIPNGMPKGASQAGLINLTKKLSVMLGPYGITVNVLEPGGMWSDGKTVGGRSREEIRRGQVQSAADKEGVSYEEMDRRMLSELVIGRRVEPVDGAELVVFLASRTAATITGEVIVADGGETRHVRY